MGVGLWGGKRGVKGEGRMCRKEEKRLCLPLYGEKTRL